MKVLFELTIDFSPNFKQTKMVFYLNNQKFETPIKLDRTPNNFNEGKQNEIYKLKLETHG